MKLRKFRPPFLIISALLIQLLLGGCITQRVSLPPMGPVDRIGIKGHNLPDGIEITDDRTIESIVRFVNSRPGRWTVPWYGPPVAQVHLEFYRQGKFVGNFGVSPGFVTRDHGQFWSQEIPEKIMRKFAGETHQAIFEGAFMIVPENIDSAKELALAEKTLNGVARGLDAGQLRAYIKASGFEITAEYPTFINVTLKKIRTGKYADTVIAGQYVLSPQGKIEQVRFFGLDIRKSSGAR